MQITAAGVLACLAAFILLIKRPDWLFYAGLFLVPFSGTAVLNIPSASFGFPVSLFMFCCYVGSLALRGRLRATIRFAPRQLAVVLLMLTFIVVLAMSLWERVLDGTLLRVNKTMLIYVCINTLIALLVACTLRTRRDLFRAFQVQAASVLFVSTWGLFQFVAPLIGVPYPDWLFNSSAAHSAQLFGEVAKGGLVRVGSVAVEPSILVQSLAYFVTIAATLLVRHRIFLGRLGMLALTAGVACTVVAASTTGYIGLAVLACILLAQSIVKSTFLLLALAAVALVLIALEPRLLDIILENTVDKSTSWSFDKRTGTVVAAFAVFLDRPALGVGWATQSAYSMPVFLLANTGIIGAGVYLCLLAALLLILLGCIRWDASGSRLSRFPKEMGDKPYVPLGHVALALLNAIIISLVMQSVSGFTYVFPDFWVLIGLVLAVAGVAHRVGHTGLPDSPSNGRRALYPVRGRSTGALVAQQSTVVLVGGTGSARRNWQ
jgi:hypothetical protein